MKKLFFALLVAVLLLPVAGLAAQEEEGFSFMSFNMGLGPAFFMDNSDLEVASTFGVDFRVAGPLIIGFAHHNVDTIGGSANLLRVKYDVLPQARAVLSFGHGDLIAGSAAPLTGLGFEFIPFRRQVGGLFTEFKLATDYVFEPELGMGDGVILFGLLLSVGF
ncbi:MAG: hypothetical protein FWC65_05985 [Treponema sp.]|nr:hypothetical protein [Treponema sp.]